MKKIRHVVGMVVLLLVTQSLHGQKLFFENYSIREGLNSNYIQDISQTTNGLILTSTYGGLSVLYPDGIKSFNEENGLLGAFPGNIYPVEDNLVLVNFNEGFSVLDLNTKNVQNFKSSTKRKVHAFSFSDGTIYSLIEHASDNKINLTYLGDSLIQVSMISDVMKQNNHILLATINNGILLYDVIEKSTKKLHSDQQPKPIFSLKNIENEIYAITGEGTYKVEDYSYLTEHELLFKDHHLYEGLLRQYEEDNIGNQWYSGQFIGVYKKSASDIVSITEKNGFTSSKVSRIFKDREGNIWFGTVGQGLFMYRNDPFSLLNQASFDLKLNNVGAIEKSGSKYIIGYAPGGLEVIDTISANSEYYSFYNSELNDDNILLLEKYNNIIYGIAINQFFKLDKQYRIKNIAKADSLNFYRGRNMSLGNDKIYISSTVGILEYDIKEDLQLSLMYSPEESQEVYFVEFFNKNLFFTTREGLFMLEGDAKNANHLLKDSIEYQYGICYDTISVYFSREGDFIVLDKSNKSVFKSKLENLVGALQSVANSNKYTYVFTDGNYYVYNTESILASEGQSVSAIKSEPHGFDVFPNSLKIFGDEIYLGTSEGIIRYAHSQNYSDTIAPSLVINYPAGFQKNADNSFYISKAVRGTPFQIYALDYRSGHNVSLTVSKKDRLNTLTKNFIELEGDFEPGVNLINIFAKDISGNTLNRQLIFNVESFWWETSTFKFILIMLAVSMIIAGYYVLIKITETKILRQEHQKRQIEEHLRENIAMDFHDELGNNLAVLSVHIEKLRIKMAEAQTFIPIVDDIRTSYKKIFENSKDLVWALNPSSDNIDEILIRAKDYGEKLFKDSGINFNCFNNIEADSKIKIRSSAAKDIMFIIKESFTNAYNHSNATEVQLTVTTINNKHSIIIADNGKGITQTDRIGRGLRYMRKRADRIGYQLTVDSSNQGTHIQLRGEGI